MLLCLSHRRTLVLLDKLGEGYDSEVRKWKEGIERTMETMQIHVCHIMYLISCIYLKNYV